MNKNIVIFKEAVFFRWARRGFIKTPIFNLNQFFFIRNDLYFFFLIFFFF